MSATEWLEAEWPAPSQVRTLITTRQGGVSRAPYTSLNLSERVGDTPQNVAANRALLRQHLPSEPIWLTQTHGIRAVAAETVRAPCEADASFTQTPRTVCTVMTADCLPVLLCDQAGSAVAAVHAGWRGLCHGIIEATVAAMARPSAPLMAWLGPAIGPDAFEVGSEVRHAFIAVDAEAAQAFIEIGEGKYLADIYLLAKQRLTRLGIHDIHGGDYCTVIERDRFFSYRRDGQCSGRMASMIWLAG